MYTNMIFLAHILTGKSDNLMSIIILLLGTLFSVYSEEHLLRITESYMY